VTDVSDDRSLFDKVKDAFGMGGDDHDHHHDDEHDHGVTKDHRLDKGGLGVDGATQGAGASGAGGGMGATAGLGGAGAGGPAGSTPDPSKDWTAPADGTNVRTEYEMGHEFDPDAEKIAESGVMAERAGEAVVDTWRSSDSDSDPEE
jgi:hypothetical protein